MNVIKIDYTNWRGERRVRTIMPIEFYFGQDDYHKPFQWLCRAYDLEREFKDVRSFALNNIHSWKQEDVP